MDFARPLFWNVPHWAEITLYLLIVPTVFVLIGGTIWRMKKWWLGQPEPGARTPIAALSRRLKELGISGRWKELIGSIFFQRRLARDRVAVVMHLAIFWGMGVLFVGTALATLDQDFASLLWDAQFLRGNAYRLFELVLDLFGVVLIAGLVIAAHRRFIVRPARLKAEVANISLWDRFPFLTILMLIALSGFCAEGLRIAEGSHLEAILQAASERSALAKRDLVEEFGIERKGLFVGEERHDAMLRRIAEQETVFPAAEWSPIGYVLSKVLSPLPLVTIRASHQVIWWVHALLAFAFIAAIPFTKAFHLISSPINLFLRQTAPLGQLTVVSESGVEKMSDFTWQELLQVDACTWCGRCQEVCPSHTVGLPVSPRNAIQRLDRLLIRSRRGKAEGNGTLHDGAISPETLWACCTCRACADICPVGVEHPRILIDMRRHLVDQGAVDEGLQEALMNLQKYGNSVGQSARKRGTWTKELDFPLVDARNCETEYLWFVGDYASYDPRAHRSTRATAQVFHRLGLNFGILGPKEQNAGNDVRRVGEEGLFEMLKEKNCEVMKKTAFQQIVTTDPHTYSTLKNEYNGHPDSPLCGRPVIHSSELFDRLIIEGTLHFSRTLDCTVTYHDPCYLGRYNGIYDAPRRVLGSLGVTLVEMPRCRENSFCCGAGGGRIWMKDVPGIQERPAEARIREALDLPGVQILVVACPKDLVMFQDAVKTVGAEDRLSVIDLGELVFEALELGAKI